MSVLNLISVLLSTDALGKAAILGVPVLFSEKVEDMIICEDRMVSSLHTW